jgi:hypothetical protein
MRPVALQPSVQSAHAARAMHSLVPAYTEPLEDPEIGTFPPTGLSLVMELPRGYLRTSEVYHRGNETGGSRRVAPSRRKAGSRLVAGALCCAGGSES